MEVGMVLAGGDKKSLEASDPYGGRDNRTSRLYKNNPASGETT